MKLITDVDEMVGKTIKSAEVYGDTLDIIFDDKTLVTFTGGVAHCWEDEFNVIEIREHPLNMWELNEFGEVSDEELIEYERKLSIEEENKKIARKLEQYERLKEELGL